MDEKVLLSLLSHELRSTLWGAEGLLRCVHEDMNEQFGEDAREILFKIQESIGEARSFLNRLIELYRVEEKPIRKKSLDLTQMIEDEFNRLLSEAKLQNVVFQLERMPPLVSDSMLIREILRELLSNALKAVQGSSSPTIKVSAVDCERGLGCEIEDNGIGFRMSQADRLFQPGGRLHPRARFPGTGLGLVLAKEMVDRLGGEIWAEGHLSKGAKFGFLLSREGKH